MQESFGHLYLEKEEERGEFSFTVYTILITKSFCTLHFFLLHFALLLVPPPTRNRLVNHNLITVRIGLLISGCHAGRIVHSLMFS